MLLLTNRIQLLFLLALAGSLFLTFPLAAMPPRLSMKCQP